MSRLSRPALVAAVAVVQLVLTAVAVAAPLSARLSGQEVRLRVSMVDPVDAFRGAYVDLSYPDLPGQPAATDREQPRQVGGTAYVPLAEGASGVWTGGEIASRRPASGRYLACADDGWRIRCGIESWFLPQGEASALASSLRGGTAVATVKVDRWGHAALTDVSVP